MFSIWCPYCPQRFNRIKYISPNVISPELQFEGIEVDVRVERVSSTGKWRRTRDSPSNEGGTRRVVEAAVGMLLRGAITVAIARSFCSSASLQRIGLSQSGLENSSTRIAGFGAFRFSHSSSAPISEILPQEPAKPPAEIGKKNPEQEKPSPKRKRNRPKRTKQAPPAYFAVWRGLSAYRRERMRMPGIPLISLSKVQDLALEAALSSSVRTQGMRHAVGLLQAAEKHRSPSRKFNPSAAVCDELLVTVIQSVMRAAEKRPDVSLLSSGGADVACEALFRCLDVFNMRPSIAALTVLLRSAKRDPIVERRSERALSIFRYSRAMQLGPTVDFVYDCFSTCVAGLDVEAAAIVMDFALANRVYREPSNEGVGPSEVDYYNGVMHAALLMGDHNTAVTAHNELTRRELKATDVTESIYLAMCFERRDERTARILLNAIQDRNGTLADCVYTAMLRAAGQKNDVAAVRSIFRDFERERGLCRENFHDIVSAQHAAFQGVNAVISDRASAAARGDPTFVVFEALRTCCAPDDALEMLEYLTREYGFRAPKAVYVLVIETCWKGGRLDLAKKVRVEMESKYAVKT